MMNPVGIAWRNLSRNRGRTAITVVAVALNTAILVLTFALMEGIFSQLLGSVTEQLVGDAQMHAPGYRKERSIYDSIPEPGKIVSAAAMLGLRAAPRTYGFGLLSHGSKSAGATFIGVDPDRERETFTLWKQTQAGTFLDRQSSGSVVIGSKLSRSLDARVGDELIAVVQAADGSLGNELYRVAGVLKTVGESLDRGAVFMLAADFGTLFLTGDVAHEIAFTSATKSESEVAALAGPLAPQAEVNTWRQLMPMISDMLNMSSAMIFLFGAVFFLAAAIGVLNTMLMSTHDRVRELGVLKALGATPWRIIAEITAEGLLLAMVATTVGAGLGVVGSLYLEGHPIDLSVFTSASFNFSGMVWDTLWRADLQAKHVVAAVIPMWFSCAVAAFYPAVKAARLDPVRAMTHV